MATKKLVGHNEERHTKNLELLQDLLKNIPGANGITDAELKASGNNILSQVRAAMEPFIALVTKTSSSRADPGGLLVKRLTNLKRGVVVTLEGTHQVIPVLCHSEPIRIIII
jgi:hypothetical protein